MTTETPRILTAFHLRHLYAAAKAVRLATNGTRELTAGERELRDLCQRVERIIVLEETA